MSDLSFDSFASTALDIISGSALKLGSVSFRGMEIPEKIPFGGTQQVAVKRLIGGRTIIESLGAVEVRPTWKGRFQGAGAMGRARAVDAMRTAGLPVQLMFGGMSSTVVITEFVAEYERAYQIPYTISCEVVSNDGRGEGLLDSTLDDLVGADTLDALGLGDIIGDVSLNSALSTLQSGLTTVGSLTGSTALSTMGSYVGTAQGAANSLSSAANSGLSGVAFGVAGVASTIGGSVSKLTGAVTAATTLANSNAVGNLLGRISANLEQ